MTRNTSLLLGILVVLVVVAYLVMQKPGEQSVSGDAGSAFVTLDSLGVDRIEIKSPASVVVLEKKGVEWFVDQPVSYRADQANVASLIHDAKSLQVKSVISDKVEKHPIFQVDSTGTLVKISEKGSEKTSFVIGKMASGYTEMYARLSSAKDVDLVSGAPSYVFSRPLKEWRDRTIFTAPRENIKEVKYQYGDTTFVLAFRDSLWMVGKDSTQEGVASNLISSLSNVQADDFIDTVVAHPPKPTAQISYAGTQLTFFYVKQGDTYLVQCSSTPQWFQVQGWHANQLLKRKKDITKSAK